MRQDTSIEGLGYSRSFLKKAFNAALYPCMLSILSNCATIIADGIIVGRKNRYGRTDSNQPVRSGIPGSVRSRLPVRFRRVYRRVRKDTFSEYQHFRQAKGARMEQSKPVRVLTRDDQAAFFHAARENV